MNSTIYTGHVMHARLEPTPHRFQYPLFMMAVDLDELPALNKLRPLFGYNRLAALSIHDKDYLNKGSGSIRERLFNFLGQRDQAHNIQRVMLVTMCRMFNYCFNPVSFYFCYDGNQKLVSVLAEVNNTFGERHFYVLDQVDAGSSESRPMRAQHDKQFHVSPFFDRKGDYEFTFFDLKDRLDIRINLRRDGKRVLITRLWGHSRALETAGLTKVLVSYPLNTILTVPRITWQAAKLYFKKRLPVYSKPNPSSEMTLRVSAPSLPQRLARKIIFGLFDRFESGQLEVVLPDRTRRTFGNAAKGDSVRLVVHNDRFFYRLLLGGDIGLGDSYMAGDWATDDLAGFLKLMIDNQKVLGDAEQRWSWGVALINQIKHIMRRNTITRARRNIAQHYDISNDFYKLFLDPTLTYSSGIFQNENDSLEDAQRNKMRRLITKLKLRPEHHLLEIGTGWGSMAIEAARQTGCRVTTITLSREQRALAMERIRDAGLADRVDVQLCDYRHVEGRFDRIVSVEMLEAVGHEFLPTYFQTLDRLLKPEGVAAIQTITIPDERYDSYRRGCDWIRKRIFPGGHLPSPGVIQSVLAKHTHLAVAHRESIGLDYARTLREWRNNFWRNINDIRGLGFDEQFIRMWDYYLNYCEAGFERHMIDNLQLVLTRRNNPGSSGRE